MSNGQIKSVRAIRSSVIAMFITRWQGPSVAEERIIYPPTFSLAASSSSSHLLTSAPVVGHDVLQPSYTVLAQP
ncbi:hypothetical protein Tco_0504629 [Tanacetum coccineum]